MSYPQRQFSIICKDEAAKPWMVSPSFPYVMHCLVSVRRDSGQRYSAFETGGLRVHRIARRGLRSPALRRNRLVACRGTAKRTRGVSETNPDKRGSLTLPAAKDSRRGECLVTACWRDALPCAIPDCRDRTPARQRRRMAPPTSAPSQTLTHYLILRLVSVAREPLLW